MGSRGSGKTLLALQTLVNGVHVGEPGIFVTFQESPRQVVENASSFGWNLAELEKKKLVFLDARLRANILKSLELYLGGMLAAIKVVANEMGAKRVVFDSIDILFSVLENPAARRREIFRLRDWLAESGLTAIVTAQPDVSRPAVVDHEEFVRSMADCVVNLKYRAQDQGATRSVRVLKYRGSGFIGEEVGFAIGAAGIVMGAAKTQPEAAGGAMLREIAETHEDFRARIKSLNHQLEIRKAELDFLVRSQEKNKADNKTAAANAKSVTTTKARGARAAGARPR
jgi:circadian clock protein KaiC